LPVLHFFRAALQIITLPRRTIEKSGETGNKLLHIQVLKEHSFTRCGKNPSGLQEVSGHDFTGCGKTHAL
jgi:hypothetical protein